MTTELLHQVARLYSIQADYRDGFGQLRKAPTEAILKVLQALGAPVASFDDLPGALRQRRQTLWQRAIEPVTVAWQGGPLVIPLRLPRRLADVTVLYQIALESGELVEGKFPDAPGFTPQLKEVEGAAYVTRRLVISAALPLGYHRILSKSARSIWSPIYLRRRCTPTRRPTIKNAGEFSAALCSNSAHSWVRATLPTSLI